MRYAYNIVAGLVVSSYSLPCGIRHLLIMKCNSLVPLQVINASEDVCVFILDWLDLELPSHRHRAPSATFTDEGITPIIPCHVRARIQAHDEIHDLLPLFLSGSSGLTLVAWVRLGRS